MSAAVPEASGGRKSPEFAKHGERSETGEAAIDADRTVGGVRRRRIQARFGI